jgi:hypothetical protein
MTAGLSAIAEVMRLALWSGPPDTLNYNWDDALAALPAF